MVGEFFGEFYVVFFCWAAAETEVFSLILCRLVLGLQKRIARLVIKVGGSGEPEACYVMSARYYLLDFGFEFHKST